MKAIIFGYDFDAPDELKDFIKSLGYDNFDYRRFKNTIGEIIASYYDGEKMRYTVSLNGKGFPLLLTEDYLNKLDMVVSQSK